ncbi:MAG: hypothetical protein PHE73_03510 [Sulfurovaceae bacterium]|nr:hypothetical protein [Sulfurovaceae bacterium]
MANDKKKTNIVTFGVLTLIAIAIITRDTPNTDAKPTDVKAYTKAEMKLKTVADAEKRKQTADKQAAAVADIEAKKQKLLERFRSNKEPEAQNATWVDGDWLYVAIWNEGGGKQGYAEYVCSIANKMGVNKINVKITDYGKALRTGEIETIAVESCK